MLPSYHLTSVTHFLDSLQGPRSDGLVEASDEIGAMSGVSCAWKTRLALEDTELWPLEMLR